MWIDRIEVAAGRQDVCHTARRCAGWACWNILAFKRIEQVLNLIAGLFKFRYKFIAGEGECSRNLPRFKSEHGALYFADDRGPKTKRFEHREEVERCAVENLQSIGARMARLAQQLERTLKTFARSVEQFRQIEAKRRCQARLQTRCTGVCQPRQGAQHLWQRRH